MESKLSYEIYEEDLEVLIDILKITSEKVKDGVVKILVDGKKTEIKSIKRVTKKISNITNKLGKEIVFSLLSKIENKEKIIEIIDSCDDVKLSELINYSDPIKLAYYFNSKRRSEIIDEIQRKTSREKIQKLAKKINNITVPKITEEKIFISN